MTQANPTGFPEIDQPSGSVTIIAKDHAPKGVTSRAEWDSQRKRNLLNACKRYSEAKWPVPIEWLEELEDLT
jgi:hypothetical protein